MKAAAGAEAAGVVPRPLAAGPEAAVRASAAGSVVASDKAAIAETTFGKVRGFAHREMFVFKGIPYGASTAGARRFMPPAKPDPWTGVRSALAFGFASPHPSHRGLPEWPAFDGAKRSTMIFDDACSVKSDPDGEELEALRAALRWS